MSCSTPSRLFIKLAYVGTNYSGVAKQLNGTRTVVNMIEEQLKKQTKTFDLLSDVRISSRTDAGVHALANTAHFDVTSTHPIGELGDLIKTTVNSDLRRSGHLIRILKCKEVPSGFVSRHALSRTYLYRLAFSNNSLKYATELNNLKKIEAKLNNDSERLASFNSLFAFTNFTSVLDKNFVTEIKEPFNWDLFMKAVELLNGQHNFSAFTTRQGREAMIKAKKNPIKNVKIEVFTHSRPFMSEFASSLAESYRIVDVEVTCSSFLYRMVRKTLGSAVSVAKGIIPIEQIDGMFSDPAQFYDDNTFLMLKPNGLYLKRVNYENPDLN